MRTNRLALFSVLASCLAIACWGEDKDPKKTDDTGEADADTDTDADGDADADRDSGDTAAPPSCTTTMNQSEPEDGTVDWYWRDTLTVDFEDAPEEQDIVSIADSEGNPVDASFVWAEHGETVTIAPSLAGSTGYTVTVNCLEEQSFSFTTNEYGTPLTIANVDLLNRTYELNLPGARFAEPPGVGALLGTYLENPLLVSPVAISVTEITLLAAQGLWDDEAVPSQDMGMATFPFPPSDWVNAPFFSGDTDQIVVTYESAAYSTEIVIHSVHLEGTFSADGATIGGAWAGGLADTRNMGPLLDMGEAEDVVCNYLASFGLPCVDCGDGGEFCLYMEAYFDDAPLVEGVVLDPDPLGTGG